MSGIPFPDLSPEIISIDVGGMTFALRWYAVSYIVGLLIAWRLMGSVFVMPMSRRLCAG